MPALASTHMNLNRVHDRVHGTIQLHPLVAAVASSPEFQRLDGVRQLGGCSYVYPSATHTRREHSLGVSYLAGAMGRHLHRQRPDLVDDVDVLCLELAGLVHDLGHGPFSHVFEEYMRRTDPAWSHETVGLEMLERIVRGNDEVRRACALHFGAAAPQHLAFVHILIEGLPADAPWPAELVGRDESKRFLADVVHNQRCGLDVDKMDYLVRDSLAVFGASQAISLSRIVSAVRVADADGAAVLAFEESVAFDLSELYALRARMHRQVYQHRAVAVVEMLLIDLMAAHDASARTGAGLADAAQDPDQFVHLVDASVLGPRDSSVASSRPFAAARAALERRPWLARVPATLRLHTRPPCAACGQETRPSDRWCAACGAGTATRSGVEVHRDRCDRPVLASQASVLRADAAEAELRALVGREDVRVVITDVHCGAERVVEDPHGCLWRDFDPVGAVTFCTVDGRLVRVQPEALHVPAVRHLRTAHCYLAADASSEEVARAREAFVEWGRRIGEVVEV